MNTTTTSGPPRATSPGLVCPACRGRKLPAVETRRAGERMVRSRRCRGCGLTVRTEESITTRAGT